MSNPPERKELSPEEISKILKAIEEAYKLKNKKLKFVEYHTDKEVKVLVDNRETSDIN